jgi:predicted metal-dependent phosphoesterase TrpH
MKIDFHVHTSQFINAVSSPRQVVKRAKKFGLDSIAITDRNWLFPLNKARRLFREFGLLIMPDIDGEEHRDPETLDFSWCFFVFRPLLDR